MHWVGEENLWLLSCLLACLHTDGKDDPEEMSAHAKMVHLGLRELLKSPLAETFLHLKWEMTKVGKNYYTNAEKLVEMSIPIAAAPRSPDRYK